MSRRRVHEYILSRQFLVWRACHCYWLLGILQVSILMLVFTWTIPQSVAFSALQSCSVQNASSYVSTICSPVCSCFATPLSLIGSVPMCSSLNASVPSGTKCNLGYNCCQYCCDTCSSCVQNRCATYSCNCRCCQSTDNDYCTWRCSDRTMYNCLVGSPLNAVVNSTLPCASGDTWKCDDTSVVHYTTVLPWVWYGLPILLTAAVLVVLFVYLLYRSGSKQVEADIAMTETAASP